MPRILKRPMFRSGGSTNEGIMHGLVDRKGYANGTEAERYRDEYMKMLAEVQPTKPRFNMGEMGLNLISGEYAGDGLLQNIAGSARGPYTAFTKADDARGGLDYQKNLMATKMGISRAEAEAIAKAKALSKDTRTSLMKELEAAGLVPGSPEYEKALRLRTLGEGTVGYSEFHSKANVDKAITAGNYASESIDFLTSIAELGARSPDAFGLKGKILGFGKDVATEVEGLHDSSLRSAAKDFGIEAGVYDDIKNPDFSKIQPLENALSIRLARTRNPRDRLMKDMIRDAKKDTNLSGLGGATKVRDRLPTIFKEFLDTATNKYKAAGKTDAEIATILNPKIKAFNEAMNKLSGVVIEGADSFNEDFKMPTKGEDGIYRF